MTVQIFWRISWKSKIIWFKIKNKQYRIFKMTYLKRELNFLNLRLDKLDNVELWLERNWNKRIGKNSQKF